MAEVIITATIPISWGFPLVNPACSAKKLLYALKSRLLARQKLEQKAVYSISQEICTRSLLCCTLLWLYTD